MYFHGRNKRETSPDHWHVWGTDKTGCGLSADPTKTKIGWNGSPPYKASDSQAGWLEFLSGQCPECRAAYVTATACPDWVVAGLASDPPVSP